MSDVVKAEDLTEREKRLLFWASFLSLAAAGFGFSFRVAMGPTYGEQLGLTNHQIGQVFGASLWPIAITMIGFSLVVDRTGYKLPMFGAFALQALSGVGTFFAESYGALYLFALCAGLGHGIVEAVINPVCAAVYPKEKTKWLTILHAAWPAGLVFGTLPIIGVDAMFGSDGGGRRVEVPRALDPAAHGRVPLHVRALQVPGGRAGASGRALHGDAAPGRLHGRGARGVPARLRDREPGDRPDVVDRACQLVRDERGGSASRSAPPLDCSRAPSAGRSSSSCAC